MLFTQDDYDNETVSVAGTGEAIHGVCFTDCRFEACRITDSLFRGCEFVDCTFHGCDLSLCRFTGSDFRQTTFTNCKLAGINWTRVTRAFQMGFQHCVLTASGFSNMKLAGIVMRHCTVHNCDFSDTVLKGADFTGSDFQETTFNHTDLRNAVFRDAVNYAIHPASNTLTGAAFSHPEVLALLNAFQITLDT